MVGRNRSVYKIKNQTFKTNDVIKLLRVVGASTLTACPVSLIISNLEFCRCLRKDIYKYD